MTLSGQGRGGQHRLRGQCLGHADDLGHQIGRADFHIELGAGPDGERLIYALAKEEKSRKN